MSPSSPHLDLNEFEKRAEEIFKEYFDHGDVQEVAASLEEFNIRNIRHEVSRTIGCTSFLSVNLSECPFPADALGCPCPDRRCS